MSSSQFQGRYTVADGYANQNSRPQYFKVSAGDLDVDATDAELLEFYQQCARDHFEQRISLEEDREAEFLVWAREQLQAIDEEGKP